jgi:NDP-sugar pyrophosphorylase family protein
MIDHHVEQGFVATMGVQTYCHEIPFGVVDLEGNQVLAIREKPVVQYQVNAGIYVLDSALRFHYQAGEPTTIPAILDKELGRGESLGYFLVDDNWVDVGRHDELSRARGLA